MDGLRGKPCKADKITSRHCPEFELLRFSVSLIGPASEVETPMIHDVAPPDGNGNEEVYERELKRTI